VGWGVGVWDGRRVEWSEIGSGGRVVGGLGGRMVGGLDGWRIRGIGWSEDLMVGGEPQGWAVGGPKGRADASRFRVGKSEGQRVGWSLDVTRWCVYNC
jgi:hypothetical protein